MNNSRIPHFGRNRTSPDSLIKKGFFASMVAAIILQFGGNKPDESHNNAENSDEVESGEVLNDISTKSISDSL